MSWPSELHTLIDVKGVSCFQNDYGVDPELNVLNEKDSQDSFKSSKREDIHILKQHLKTIQTAREIFGQ